MEIVKVIKLSKSIGVKNVLKNVTIIIRRGDRVNIYGERESGKTIFIKCLLDMVVRDSGTVSIFGYDPLNYRREILRRVGYIPQDPQIRTRIKLGTILDLIHNLYNVDYRLLEELGLLGMMNKDVRKLDMEYLIRLYTYITLVKRPELIFIDGIDSKIDGKSIYLLRRYIDRVGATILTTSRKPSTILGENRHALMDTGRLYEFPG